MARRVQFQTLSTAVPTGIGEMPTAELMPGHAKYLKKLDELEARYSGKQPPKKTVRKTTKKKKKKTTKRRGKTKRFQARRKNASTGLALTKRLTLRRIVNRLPWTGKPLSLLLGIDGWLPKRTTLNSLISKIPQSKKALV